MRLPLRKSSAGWIAYHVATRPSLLPRCRFRLYSRSHSPRSATASREEPRLAMLSRCRRCSGGVWWGTPLCPSLGWGGRRESAALVHVAGWRVGSQGVGSGANLNFATGVGDCNGWSGRAPLSRRRSLVRPLTRRRGSAEHVRSPSPSGSYSPQMCSPARTIAYALAYILPPLPSRTFSPLALVGASTGLDMRPGGAVGPRLTVAAFACVRPRARRVVREPSPPPPRRGGDRYRSPPPPVRSGRGHSPPRTRSRHSPPHARSRQSPGRGRHSPPGRSAPRYSPRPERGGRFSPPRNGGAAARRGGRRAPRWSLHTQSFLCVSACLCARQPVCASSRVRVPEHRVHFEHRHTG